jgi:hypothetical protein
MLDLQAFPRTRGELGGAFESISCFETRFRKASGVIRAEAGGLTKAAAGRDEGELRVGLV